MPNLFVKRISILIVILLIGIFAGSSSLRDIFSNVVEKPTNQVSSVSTASTVSKANIDPNRTYRVTDVIDGDTFIANIDGESITVRMLGIDTPETVDPRKPEQCYGKEASMQTKSLIGGKSVKLVLDIDREKSDKYGRLLSYVYGENNLFINEFLVREGFAREYTFGKVYDHQQAFRSAQKEAESTSKGLWGKCSKQTS